MPQDDEYYSAPAPRVEEARVDNATAAEPANVPPAPFTESATAPSAPHVEAATTLYTGLKRSAAEEKVIDGLPTIQVRGKTGADFESYAAVIQGTMSRNFLQLLLPCLYDDPQYVTYGEVKYYVLVKDGLCYVYVAETDPSPLYAIELSEYFATQEDPRKPGKNTAIVSPMPMTNLPPETMKTVLLKNKSNGAQAFQFTFDCEKDPNLAKTFYDCVQNDKKSKEKGAASAASSSSDKKEKQ